MEFYSKAPWGDDMASDEHMEEDEQGLNSLCWTCQRAGWRCLCQWPEDKTGIEFITNVGEEVIYIVTSCLKYWLDPNSKLDVNTKSNLPKRISKRKPSACNRIKKKDAEEQYDDFLKRMQASGTIPDIVLDLMIQTRREEVALTTNKKHRKGR